MSIRSKILVALSSVAVACVALVATPAAISHANAATPGGFSFSINPNSDHHNPY